ncbi:Ff.00g085410.m01.CDS01 [Fusarium sp. VM40]|nr:Ff.00g085410.m01.CDS01 [Fusarium sp. VM40]
MAHYGRLSVKLIIRRHVKDSTLIYLDACHETLKRSNRESESSYNDDVTRLFLAPAFEA